MAFKVALLGIYHESNTFLKSATTLTDFEKGHWLWGNRIREEYQNAHHEIGGMLEILDQENIEAIPVMFAEATPGGIISKMTYETLLNKMLDELEKHLPVDGCMVIPHGAAVSEKYSDMDGHWLKQLREKFGPDIPVTGTLDPHANVSQLMTSSTNALVAYKTNPHIDQRRTGKEAARLMVKVLKEKTQLTQVLNKPPLAISIEQQLTEENPCKSLLSFAKKLEQTNGILSVSICFGFPYADVKEMGTSVIVVSDKEKQSGIEVAEQIESYLMRNKHTFVGNKKNIHEVISYLPELEKPVLFLDMGDNVGGGAPGNSYYLLKEIEKHNTYKTFICLFNPEVVLIAENRKPGEDFEIRLEGENAMDYYSRVILRKFIENGEFHESDPRHGGQMSFNMGKSAIVMTEKGNTIMFNSIRIPPFSLKQLTGFGINPKEYDIIIAKGVNAPIAAYAPVCPTSIKINTPGVTQADMTNFIYKNRRKPLYPFEN